MRHNCIVNTPTTYQTPYPLLVTSSGDKGAGAGSLDGFSNVSEERPKSEYRKPKTERRPKAEIRRRLGLIAWYPATAAASSGFGFRASFGFRLSGFGFPFPRPVPYGRVASRRTVDMKMDKRHQRLTGSPPNP